METTAKYNKIRIKQMQIQAVVEPQQKQLQKLQLEKEIEQIRKRIEQLG